MWRKHKLRYGVRNNISGNISTNSCFGDSQKNNLEWITVYGFGNLEVAKANVKSMFFCANHIKSFFFDADKKRMFSSFIVQM